MTKTRATKAAQEKGGKKAEQDLTWPGADAMTTDSGFPVLGRDLQL